MTTIYSFDRTFRDAPRISYTTPEAISSANPAVAAPSLDVAASGDYLGDFFDTGILSGGDSGRISSPSTSRPSTGGASFGDLQRSLNSALDTAKGWASPVTDSINENTAGLQAALSGIGTTMDDAYEAGRQAVGPGTWDTASDVLGGAMKGVSVLGRTVGAPLGAAVGFFGDQISDAVGPSLSKAASWGLTGLSTFGLPGLAIGSLLGSIFGGGGNPAEAGSWGASGYNPGTGGIGARSGLTSGQYGGGFLGSTPIGRTAAGSGFMDRSGNISMGGAYGVQAGRNTSLGSRSGWGVQAGPAQGYGGGGRAGSSYQGGYGPGASSPVGSAAGGKASSGGFGPGAGSGGRGDGGTGGAGFGF